MARRKLSPERRDSLRKDIVKLSRHGREPGEIQRHLARKYSVRTATVRWYMRSAPTAPGDADGSVPSFKAIETAERSAEQAIRRARIAKKLIPQWKAAVARELALRKKERALQTALRHARERARSLHTRLAELGTL